MPSSTQYTDLWVPLSGSNLVGGVSSPGMFKTLVAVLKALTGRQAWPCQGHPSSLIVTVRAKKPGLTGESWVIDWSQNLWSFGQRDHSASLIKGSMLIDNYPFWKRRSFVLLEFISSSVTWLLGSDDGLAGMTSGTFETRCETRA
jgi:hypothetical protein